MTRIRTRTGRLSACGKRPQERATLIITSHALSTLFLGTLVGLTMSTRTAEGITMDDKVRKKVAEAAAKENDWKLDEVAIDEKEELRRPGGSVSVARHNGGPLSYVATFP